MLLKGEDTFRGVTGLNDGPASRFAERRAGVCGRGLKKVEFSSPLTGLETFLFRVGVSGGLRFGVFDR